MQNERNEARPNKNLIKKHNKNNNNNLENVGMLENENWKMYQKIKTWTLWIWKIETPHSHAFFYQLLDDFIFSEFLHFILRLAIIQHSQTHIADSSQSLFILAISLNLQYVLLGRKSLPNRDAGVSLVVLYSIVVGIYCLMHTYTSTTDRELFDTKNLVKNSLFFGCYLLIHISR